MSETEGSAGAVEGRRPTRAELARRLARAVQAMSTGDQAELRRLRPEDPSCSAFWRLCASVLEPAGVLPAGGEARDRAEARWAAVIASAALLDHLVRPRRSLGEALARAQYSELRFVRLLRASEGALLDAVLSAARFLRAKAEPADPADVARLLFTDGTDHAESTRRQLARAYYRTSSNSSTDS